MNTSLKAKIKLSLVLLLTAALLFSLHGCLPLMLYSIIEEPATETTIQEVPEYTADGTYNDLSYEELCDVLFEHEVTADNLTLNQLVVDPEALELEVPRPATLGEYSYAATQEDNRLYSEILEALTYGVASDTSVLNDRQMREAEYLEAVLRQELEFEQYHYYDEPLSPSTGAQAALPLSFMDYSFRTVDDLDIYLELLEDVPRYFNDLILHEQEKEARNLMMPREAIDDSIEEARAYTGGAESHILVEAFNEMLDAALAEDATDEASGDGISSLAAEEVAAYKQRNLEAVQTYVIPGYETLLRGLEELAPSCREGTRLIDYEHGAEYYELVLESMGFSEGASDAAATLDSALDGYWNTLASNSAAFTLDSMIPEEVVQNIGETPEDYITYIMEHSKNDFASTNELNYTVREAPEASPNDYAMAYFLIPPVDDPQQNNIVFFPRNISDDVELYSTMAHEAYPGHMYQVYAYSLQEPNNMNKLLGSIGYMEGWAMYAQAYAIRYLDTNASAIEAYIAYEKFVYAIQARVDVGVNFEGWTVRDTEDYLRTWGFESAAEDIYIVSIQQPVAYMPYGLGVIEFDDLRMRAEIELGSEFNAVLFNQMITGAGPLPFDMLEEEVEAWIRSALAQAA